MGYLHINNLYAPRAKDILAFKTLFALEKIHGTSANIKWHNGNLTFFSGGESHQRFVGLFDQDVLKAAFLERVGIVDYPVVVYGEAYGGKQQRMSHTYGPDLKFVAFDVNINDSWLSVPRADGFVTSLGLEFVDYALTTSDMQALDEERDRPSTQAKRNGIIEDKIREGIVIRPPFEVTLNDGGRLIVKHKRDEFRETASPQVDLDPTKAQKMLSATTTAEEWATAMRFEHVVDRLIRDRDDKNVSMTDTRELIVLMVEDIKREGLISAPDEKAFSKAVGAKVVTFLKDKLKRELYG